MNENVDSAAARAAATTVHPDDLAVDRFAAAMKAKLAKKRAEGRTGWDDPEQCDISTLACMLVEHMDKTDPVDIANFAMMLHQRGSGPEELRKMIFSVDDDMVNRAIYSRYPVFDMWSETLRREEQYKMRAALKAALGQRHV